MFKGDLPEVVSEWKRLVNSESDEKMRGAYVILAKTFAAFVGRPIWQQELEGFNVITSPIFDEIRNEARKEGHKEGLKEGHKEGLKEGLKEGHKEGLKEGLKEGRTETQREVATAFRPELLEFLTSKFGSGVSSGITARINAELDFEVLNRWFRAARISNTVEEFLKQMELKK
jgi:flagellar biosynthesis/type III secretory pathway protein FliH